MVKSKYVLAFVTGFLVTLGAHLAFGQTPPQVGPQSINVVCGPSELMVAVDEAKGFLPVFHGYSLSDDQKTPIFLLEVLQNKDGEVIVMEHDLTKKLSCAIDEEDTGKVLPPPDFSKVPADTSGQIND